MNRQNATPVTRLNTLVVAALTLGSLGSVAGAQVDGSIVQPQSASTSYHVFTNASNLVNMSGLSAPYVSGETDFDTYVPATTGNYVNSSVLLCNTNGQNQPNGVVELGGTITLDLGAAMPIDSLAMWSVGGGGAAQAITAFDLYADDDADYANGTTGLLGSYTPATVGSGQTASFDALETRFLHVVVTGYGGDHDFLRVGEFAVRYADPACPADLDGNGVLNLDDINAFASAFTTGDLLADIDGNGVLNLDDVNLFAAAFIAGCG